MGVQSTKQAHIHHLQMQEEKYVQEGEKENMEIEQMDQISVENQKFPFCIVWTSIPVLTWIIPCIGHTGICTSEGTIHDFGGPYYIAIDNFTFGKPLKYLKLNEDFQVPRQSWDDAVLKADDEYSQQMHNLFTNNCHSHVAKALNNMKYEGKKNYSMFHIWLMLLLSGQYVSIGKFVNTFLPSAIFYGIILLVVFSNQ
ncbi:unnamed protein product [Paramecium pentaurelia]|uniref:Uncharacterized protein n=1 Tax=Paramecium pentaurelia TaxID=43138 RepID=A0A8S1UGV3_9CILI|nr:unnamed protein product [Paramecium pentaurelia]